MSLVFIKSSVRGSVSGAATSGDSIFPFDCPPRNAGNTSRKSKDRAKRFVFTLGVFICAVGTEGGVS